jgi:peptidyl-prolyl cis-trans isomerase C
MMLAMMAVASLVACKGGGSSTSGTATSGKDVKVIAEVNGKAVTSEDFDREVKALPEYVRAMAETPQGRKEMVDTLVMRELILQQAAKDGLDKSKEIEEKMVELRKRLIIDTYLKKKVETEAKISDDELKKFYDQNIDKFKSGDQIKASHILVKTEEEAKKVQAQLKAGAKFDELAKKTSVDTSAAKGGDLGWFGKGNMVPAFETAAFALKEGETSGIVRSEFGFHIIKLTGKRAAGTRPFEEVKEQIRGALMPQKQQQVFQKLKEEIKKGAKIEFKEQTAAPEAPKPADLVPAAPAQKK